VPVAGSSAEPIREKTVKDFCAAFAQCGLRGDALTPIYGSAEHFGVSMKRIGQPARIMQAGHAKDSSPHTSHGEIVNLSA